RERTRASLRSTDPRDLPSLRSCCGIVRRGIAWMRARVRGVHQSVSACSRKLNDSHQRRLVSFRFERACNTLMRQRRAKADPSDAMTEDDRLANPSFELHDHNLNYF